MELNQLPKMCVILGAGASTDVHNGSAPILERGTWKPPLAKDLFGLGRHADYFDILARYPDAQALAALLSPLSELTEFDLEKELRRLADHPDARVRRQFKYIPPYLRDLLWAASNRYTPTPGTYLQLIYGILADTPHHVLFLTLNYDNLLEKGLTLFDPKIDFANIESYVKDDRQAKVVKLHGSINWFKLIGGPDQPWQTLVDSQDLVRKTPDKEIYIFDTQDPLTGVLITGNRPYPILTAPLAGKGTADIVSPEPHILAAKDFLKDCRKFLIIGTSGLDEDLMSFLGKTVPVLDIRLEVIDIDDSLAQQILRRFQDAGQAFLTAKCTTFGSGFRRYVTEGNLRVFASAPLP